MKYYIKPDSKINNEFPDKNTAPVLEPADGLQEVDVPATSVQYFTRYWWQYRLLGNGRLQAPGNLPNVDIDYLQGIIDRQAAQIEAQTKTVAGLQQALGQATQAQVQAQQKFDTSNQQFQQQFGALTQQFVVLQKQIADLKPTETTDTK